MQQWVCREQLITMCNRSLYVGMSGSASTLSCELLGGGNSCTRLTRNNRCQQQQQQQEQMLYRQLLQQILQDKAACSLHYWQLLRPAQRGRWQLSGSKGIRQERQKATIAAVACTYKQRTAAAAIAVGSSAGSSSGSSSSHQQCPAPAAIEQANGLLR